jgi:NADH:ubiquinone reductase (non-electrogenic)
MSKPTVVVIGSGWAGFTLSQKLSLSKYNVLIISPERCLQYTPLLASAACGLFDFRLAEEPVVRRSRVGLQYHNAIVDDIDFNSRSVRCIPAVCLIKDQKPYYVTYDKLIIACGCGIQTFSTPGAEEYALFLRTTNDARAIQQRLLEMLDSATLPNINDERQREIMTIRIVGAGAIGIEATAELYDLWHEGLEQLYPQLKGKATIAIHDVASTVLSTFDQNLAGYALQSLKDKSVQIHAGSHIERVECDAIITKEEGRLPYGMLIWATGNKANPMIEKLPVKKTINGLRRILTDKSLRVFRSDGSVVNNVYALGDAADIEAFTLPTLAEVALQKGNYLARELNASDKPKKPFEYRQKRLVAYLGKHDGIIGGQHEYTGPRAWLAWRSASLSWTRTWKRKAMISMSWFLNWLVGRDIASKY